MPTNRRILIAVEKSAATQQAVTYVADMLAGNPEFQVGLLHLEVPPRMAEWGGSEDPKIEEEISEERALDYQGMEQRAVESRQPLLQGLQAVLAERQVKVVSQLVEFEERLTPKTVASHLLKTARERDYGTVVVGRKSWSGLKSFLAHHVGEELVRTGDGITIWVVE
jgi:hypothetical protein